jgi:flagellar assembly factor FliW
MLSTPTRYHGDIEYEEAAVLHFASGLFGFAAETRFLAIEQPGARPLVFLQSLATPGLCFLALPVFVVDREYQLSLSPEDLEQLEFPPDVQPAIGADVLCLTLITIQEGRPTSANLLAPVIVNLHNNRSVQAISTRLGYSHQYPFLESLQEAVCS